MSIHFVLLPTTKLLHSRDLQFVILISFTRVAIGQRIYLHRIPRSHHWPQKTKKNQKNQKKTMKINAFWAQRTEKWNNSVLVVVGTAWKTRDSNE